MGTPLGDFVRAKRDSIQPEEVGLPSTARRRAPGLRRTDVAERTGISVEYLTRIEQGRDRNPSQAVLNALGQGLGLDPAERRHLSYLAKITGGACAGPHEAAPPRRDIRPTLQATLTLLEPGVAMVTNRLGDVLAHTSGFVAVMGRSGLLDVEHPNLTRYVFTDPRARTTFTDWDRVADEQAFGLWLAPTVAQSEWLRAELAPIAGPEFTRRLDQHLPPSTAQLRTRHPAVDADLRWDREVFETTDPETQQLVVHHPADDATAQALIRLRSLGQASTLRAI
ncbi:MAG TPA: helix-turn-helix transcriptional regulator [Nocardioides sp.]|uniref:helix-turn-helix transcriptional regulator n=1 Tax=Nocardioides sp. TaxID=35761 RepID=UPI002E2FFE14|nr:helix-turn-helix transcriptional regulator [Nocardioides sp.]HEX5087365.1 helix-turn-helix transcriptional regulator [Nocardioides sp.]